jgi:uncharacterized protein (DUF2062 family)
MVAESVWPRGGWGRAAQYVQHRVRRLPDSPHRIARGIFAGVFVSFTPLYGLHFVAAMILAKAMQGNIIAALLSTFFGNPITFPIIAASSLRLGHWILGTEPTHMGDGKLAAKFSGAFEDLWHNTVAIFTPERASWAGLREFYADVFLPYLVGGIVPGVIAAMLAYYLSLPVIQAYQNRRRGRLQAKLGELRARSTQTVRKKAPEPR